MLSYWFSGATGMTEAVLALAYKAINKALLFVTFPLNNNLD